MKNKYVFVTVMLAVLLFLGVGLTEIYVNHTEEKDIYIMYSDDSDAMSVNGETWIPYVILFCALYEAGRYAP